eukprot:9487399-Pyramimonas_sp.AAC.3
MLTMSSKTSRRRRRRELRTHDAAAGHRLRHILHAVRQNSRMAFSENAVETMIGQICKEGGVENVVVDPLSVDPDADAGHQIPY